MSTITITTSCPGYFRQPDKMRIKHDLQVRVGCYRIWPEYYLSRDSQGLKFLFSAHRTIAEQSDWRYRKIIKGSKPQFSHSWISNFICLIYNAKPECLETQCYLYPYKNNVYFQSVSSSQRVSRPLAHPNSVLFVSFLIILGTPKSKLSFFTHSK